MNADDLRRIAAVGAGVDGPRHPAGVRPGRVRGRPALAYRSEPAEGPREQRGNLQGWTHFGVITRAQAEAAPARLRASTALVDAVAGADAVIESVYEHLALKQQVFGELDRLCPLQAILASSTSTLPLSSLQSATRRPDKVLLANYSSLPHITFAAAVARGQSHQAEELVAQLVAND